MMQKLKNILSWIGKGLAGLLVLLMLFLLVSVGPVDRDPYPESEFYATMQARLDSLTSALPSMRGGPTLQAGWARVSLTPEQALPLAGYGARKPKEMAAVHDSVFVRSLVLHNGHKQVALLSADLLIIHPEVKKSFDQQLTALGWEPDQVFLMATHSHSSIGAWAPGLVGTLFSGAYDSTVVEWIAGQMVKSITQAHAALRPAQIGFGNAEVPELIFNRLVKERGIIDPWLQALKVSTPAGHASFGIYGAHATCYGHRFRQLSGDYPAAYHTALAADSSLAFTAFAAGAVASMGYNVPRDTVDKAGYMGRNLAQATSALMARTATADSTLHLRSFRIPLALRPPQLKISQNLAMRSWLFRATVGEYPAELSVLQLNNLLWVGTPCDFSGELAMPLYAYAREQGLRLVITSFNGGYIGYVPKDDWYDLEKYETRTMAWYGHDNGAYFSELIRHLIDLSAGPQSEM